MSWMEEELKREAKAIAKQKKEEFPEEFKARIKERRFKLSKDKVVMALSGIMLISIISGTICIGNIDAISRKSEGIVENENSDVFRGYQAPDGSYWIDEETYIEYKEFEKPIANDNYYMAPDGLVWASKQDYLDYTNSPTYQESTSSINDPIIDDRGYFQAPDGSVWENKEEYDNYKTANSSQNNTIIGYNYVTGEGINIPEGFKVPENPDDWKEAWDAYQETTGRKR